MVDVAASYLLQVGKALSNPIGSIWGNFLTVTPGIIAFILVVIFAYILSSLLGALTHAFLNATKIDDHVRKARVSHSIGFVNLATLGGALIKWYTFALFVAEAASQFGLGVVSQQISKLAELVPQVFTAVIIVLGGLIVADFAADRMLHAKRKGVRLASSVVRWSIIIVVIITALKQIGIDVTIVSSAVLIALAAIGVGLAVAVAIGFSAAFKEEAKDIIKSVKKNW